MLKQNFGVVGTLFIAVLTVALDIAVVGPCIPALQQHFGVDERQIAWVLSAFVLFNLAGVPIMSLLADRVGRRFAFVLDILLFASGALVVATSRSFAILLVGRCLQGAGASGIFPVASAFVGDAFEPHERGKALGILGSVFGLAFIVGPILASILLKESWRYVFLLPLPLALISLILAFLLLPKGTGERKGRLDFAGLALFTLVVASIAFGLNGLDAGSFWKSLASVRVAPFLLFGMIGLPLFVMMERVKANPFIDTQLFSTTQIVLAVLIAVGAGMSESMIVFIPSYASSVFGVDQSTASRMFLPLAAAVAIGSPLFGRLVDRMGPRLVVAFGATFLMFGSGLLLAEVSSEAIFYSATILMGAGLAALLGSAINYIMLEAVDVSRRTAAQGLVTLSVNVGLMLGGAVLGAVIAGASGGFTRGFILVLGVALLILAMSMRLKGRRNMQD